MKKFIDGLQLVLFVGIASLLYLYAGNMIGASIQEQKNIIDMKLADSYKIWKAINRLEDLWYSSSTGEVRPLADSKIVAAKLVQLAKPYGELWIFVVGLLKARKDDDAMRFAEQKEKIAKILRPIWRQASLAERERRSKMGLLDRIKENVTQAMNRLYFYFFPTKQTKTKLVGEFDETAGTYKVKTVEQ
ncbi:MAG TPA: hypothetical protein VJ201_03535 [Candidatus Babeliales bacterium]|nr:hypothetical protein [Candidatus Babeliales bacterium]HLC07031.1 hypothetical protein [Candidatus Babeliales bacterium]